MTSVHLDHMQSSGISRRCPPRRRPYRLRPHCEGLGEQVTGHPDRTASATIAQFEYGSGIPSYRLESLEGHLGIPLAAATHWIVEGEDAHYSPTCQPPTTEMQECHESQVGKGEHVESNDVSSHITEGGILG